MEGAHSGRLVKKRKNEKIDKVAAKISRLETKTRADLLYSS